MPGEPENQRIARLTPLAEVLARINALVPVEPREVDLSTALFRVLAEDVRAQSGLPAQARALLDGYAVRAEDLVDAGSYGPVPLAVAPVRVEVGDALPPGTDAVATLDAIVDRGGRFAAIAPVAAGDWVLPACADVRANDFIARAGWRLNDLNLAMLAMSGKSCVGVRQPLVRLVKSRPDPVLDAITDLLARALYLRGSAVQRSDGDLAVALADTTPHAIIAIGGTGSGRNDASVLTLARHGRVEAHGIAIAPGETAAFGLNGARPVLLLPGRIDAALAGWLTIGVPLIHRLSGSSDAGESFTLATLARKVASALGLAEVVPMRLTAGKAEPIASGYWPLASLAASDGWILVAADSEGFPGGAEVMVRPWP